MENKKMWFKRRRYGYGWTPVVWQGWLVIVLFFVVIILGILQLVAQSKTVSLSGLLGFLSFIAIAIFLLFITAYKKGPSPKWRWGKKETDNPHEDF